MFPLFKKKNQFSMVHTPHKEREEENKKEREKAGREKERNNRGERETGC